MGVCDVTIDVIRIVFFFRVKIFEVFIGGGVAKKTGDIQNGNGLDNKHSVTQNHLYFKLRIYHYFFNISEIKTKK